MSAMTKMGREQENDITFRCNNGPWCHVNHSRYSISACATFVVLNGSNFQTEIRDRSFFTR